MKNPKLGRLLGIVLLLRSRKWVSADEIANHFGVSHRTIYRDIATLQSHDVPIKGVPGPDGGYRIDSESPFPQILFNSDEALGLYLLGAGHSDLPEPIRQAGKRAIASFNHIRDPELNSLLDRVGSRIYFDTLEWYWRDEGTGILPTIREAVFQQRHLNFKYIERVGDQTKDITLAPYGIVWKGGQWYLVGCSSKGFISRYRVSRIRGLQDTGRHFDYPEDFSLRHWWENDLENFGKGNIPVNLRVLGDAQEDFQKITAKETTKIEFDDNVMYITLFVDKWKWLIPVILSYSNSVIVESPPELRDYIIGSLQNTLGHYGKELHEYKNKTECKDKMDFGTYDDSRSRATRGRET